jgi:hypothetical protein
LSLFTHDWFKLRGGPKHQRMRLKTEGCCCCVQALLGDEFLQQLVGRLRAGAWGRVEELLIPENVYGDAGLELLVQALVDGEMIMMIMMMTKSSL